MPRSRRGSLKRRLVPSRLILMVTGVSGVVVDDDAMITMVSAMDEGARSKRAALKGCRWLMSASGKRGERAEG
jgi:hypothetical protein